MHRNESYDDLVDLAGEVAVSLWEPDDLIGFSEALRRTVFAAGYVNEFIPLPDGIAAYIRMLAEQAGAWPDADAVPGPLTGQGN